MCSDLTNVQYMRAVMSLRSDIFAIILKVKAMHSDVIKGQSMYVQ